MPETPKRDLLLLCLYLGGQRPTQLSRARLVDLDLSANTITLFDAKGARTQPRVHILHLSEEAARIFKRLSDRSYSFVSNHDGQSSLLFTNDGKTGLRVETVSALVNDIATEMLEVKELRESFELRDIRRTCETMMAALKISSDIRAQIQSHGLGGVQARHYDRHNYMDEKRDALEKWNRYLEKLITGKTGQVIPIHQYR
jgi:integrase